MTRFAETHFSAPPPEPFFELKARTVERCRFVGFSVVVRACLAGMLQMNVVIPSCVAQKSPNDEGSLVRRHVYCRSTIHLVEPNDIFRVAVRWKVPVDRVTCIK